MESVIFKEKKYEIHLEKKDEYWVAYNPILLQSRTGENKEEAIQRFHELIEILDSFELDPNDITSISIKNNEKQKSVMIKPVVKFQNFINNNDKKIH